jgi:putative copper export protein/cytochrome c553
MMDVCLKMVHYLSLCVALGCPLWWISVWCPVYGACTDEVSRRLFRRLRVSVLLGTGLFVVSGLADAVRVAAQVIDPWVLTDLWFFLSASQYGQMALLKALLLPVGVASFFLAGTLPAWIVNGSLGLCGLLTLGALSLTSHAAGQPGFFPVLNDLTHVLGAVVWGGGLFAWVHVPWTALHQDLESHVRGVGKALERFSLLATAIVILLATSGVIAAFLQTYGILALTQTPYGRAVGGKIAALLLALGIASYHDLVLSPGFQRQVRRLVPATASRLLRRFGWLVRVEAAVVAGALLLAGLLTTLPPATDQGVVARTAWEQPVGEMHMRLMMVPTETPGQVQFIIDLSPQDGHAVPGDTQVFLQMRMPEHGMQSSRLQVSRIANGSYSTTDLVSMAGRWQIDVTIQPPQTTALSTTVDFEAAVGARDRDRQRRVELAAAQTSLVHALSCLLGVLLGGLALVVIWGSHYGRLPRRLLPFGFGLLVCGGYLCLRIVLVNAYPTTYVKNPVPLTSAALANGQRLFQAHCTTCHGVEGRGDGPAAATLAPPPADFTAPHLDDHTDGDLFWWLTHGMPDTAMPAWEGTLSATERWQIIHVLRERRRQAEQARLP